MQAVPTLDAGPRSVRSGGTSDTAARVVGSWHSGSAGHHPCWTCLPEASRQDTLNPTSSRIALALPHQALTTMLWLAELLVYSVWTATEGVVRFEAGIVRA
jgi:hypothetical protein